MTDETEKPLAYDFECDLEPSTGNPRIRFNFPNGWSASVLVRCGHGDLGGTGEGIHAMIASVAACPTFQWGAGQTELGESEASSVEVAAYLNLIASRPPTSEALAAGAYEPSQASRPRALIEGLDMERQAKLALEIGRGFIVGGERVMLRAADDEAVHPFELGFAIVDAHIAGAAAALVTYARLRDLPLDVAAIDASRYLVGLALGIHEGMPMPGQARGPGTEPTTTH